MAFRKVYRDGGMSKISVMMSIVLVACISVGIADAFTPPFGVIIAHVGKPIEIQFVAKKNGELFHQLTPADCSRSNNVAWLIANGKCYTTTCQRCNYSKVNQSAGGNEYNFTLTIPSPDLTNVGIYVVRDDNGRSSGDVAASQLALFDQTSSNATSVFWELCGINATLAAECGNRQAIRVAGNETCNTYAINARDDERFLPRSLRCNFTVRVSPLCVTPARSHISWIETITLPDPVSEPSTLPTTIMPISNPVTSGSGATNEDNIFFLVVLTAVINCFRQ